MNLPQMDKPAREDTPQYLSRRTRAAFTGFGAFLILQDIALVVFFLQRAAWTDPWIVRAMAGWAVLSMLAACWFILKSAQCAGKVHSGAEEPLESIGRPDKNFSLPSLCAMMEEGLALVRAETILYANNSFSYLLGVQEDELVNTNIRNYIHPEDASLLDLGESKRKHPGPNPHPLAGKTRESGGHDGLLPVRPPTRSTLRMTTSLGDYRWVICAVHNILWQGEEASLLLFENLGPLKQAQRSLEEHEQQSRIFLERTPLAVAMFDALGQINIANSAWYSVWSNVTGAMPKRFNLLQDSLLPRPDLEKAVRQAFGKTDSGVTNLEHTTPWGETRWFNINFHPMLTLTGNLIGVMMIQQDITDNVRSSRREHELSAQLSALRDEALANQKRYAGIFDTHPAAIVCFDEFEKIRLWNKAAEAHFGLRRQEALGREITRIGQKMAPYLSLLSQLATTRENMLERIQEYETGDGRVSETVKIFRAAEQNALTTLRIEKITPTVQQA
ncbi:MAG: PAS domain S-box protein [Deltaproteobacteria bacterium]|nr:PAS domain S-box protein [Deltaproteobacteria bacterium]